MYFLRFLNQTKLIYSAVRSRNNSTDCRYVELLEKRTILRLSGPDTTFYLQNLMTNDMKKIEHLPSAYSLFLNSRGKVLYDIILYKICNNEYLLEYEKTAVEHLQKHLLMYCMRKDVKIEPVTDVLPWVIYSNVNKISPLSEAECIVNSLCDLNEIITVVKDPRIEFLGIRVLTKKETDLPTLLSSKKKHFVMGDSYTILRYKLGVGEGVLDHPPGNCLPFDTNIDFLNGISFDKGCYIGQELTARSHFVLNVKKRLMPIILEPSNSYPVFPPECIITDEKDQKVGRLRSHFGQNGLGLLKYEDCAKSKLLKLKDYNIKLEYVKPLWWPSDIDNKN